MINNEDWRWWRGAGLAPEGRGHVCRQAFLWGPSPAITECAEGPAWPASPWHSGCGRSSGLCQRSLPFARGFHSVYTRGLPQPWEEPGGVHLMDPPPPHAASGGCEDQRGANCAGGGLAAWLGLRQPGSAHTEGTRLAMGTEPSRPGCGRPRHTSLPLRRRGGSAKNLGCAKGYLSVASVARGSSWARERT